MRAISIRRQRQRQHYAAALIIGLHFIVRQSIKLWNMHIPAIIALDLNQGENRRAGEDRWHPDWIALCKGIDWDMVKEQAMAEDRTALASADDIRRILGTLDEAKLLDIVALRPTVVDVEQASLWLAGDPDVFGAGRPLQTAAGEIVAILTADDEEEPGPRS